MVPAQDAPSGKGGGFYNYGMLLGVPPFIEDVETLSRDAKELFRDGIIDSVALSCPIVPRGDPPTNKADAFAEMFRALRKRLEGSGIPTGILLYATMGHGGSSTMPSPFQKIILGRNGKVSPFFCPEDEKFCDYIGQNIRKLGQEKPDFFIVDDDARRTFQPPPFHHVFVRGAPQARVQGHRARAPVRRTAAADDGELLPRRAQGD